MRNMLKIFVYILILFFIICPTIYLCIRGTLISFFESNDNIIESIEISLMDTSKYDTLFSPLTVFFAAAGTILTAIVLINQFKTTRIQFESVKNQYEATRIQKEESIINNFNSQLNMMILMRTDIINTVVLDNSQKYYSSSDNFKVGKVVFSIIVDNIFQKELKSTDRNYDLNSFYPNDNLGTVFLRSLFTGGNEECMEKFIYFADKKISKITHGTLSPFFHNVYTTLKMIEDNKYLTIEDKNNYFRMIRSHFTQPEFFLIYYHALVYNDDGERKFKKLIEDTCFFHSIIQNEIPIKINEDKYPKLGYKLSAFYHPDEIKKMKEAQDANKT